MLFLIEISSFFSGETAYDWTRVLKPSVASSLAVSLSASLNSWDSSLLARVGTPPVTSDSTISLGKDSSSFEVMPWIECSFRPVLSLSSVDCCCFWLESVCLARVCHVLPLILLVTVVCLMSSCLSFSSIFMLRISCFSLAGDEFVHPLFHIFFFSIILLFLEFIVRMSSSYSCYFVLSLKSNDVFCFFLPLSTLLFPVFLFWLIGPLFFLFNRSLFSKFSFLLDELSSLRLVISF